MLERRLKLGRFLGIGVYVHWTFGLLVAYVAYETQSQGLIGIAFGLAQLFAVFFCVTLHEYGHALAARQFGIPTIDITLLPIGGVARLQRMPRIAWQELVVAVAGPAVNVVIASLLLVGFYLFGGVEILIEIFHAFVGPVETVATAQANGELAEMEVSADPSFLAFCVILLAVNIMLVVFNMIPAFPMDGGRVLRSLLAMVTHYRRATFLASRIGIACAILMAMAGVYVQAPGPVLVAMFIAYAGISEARQVEMMESVRGLSVSNVMTHCHHSIPMDATLDEAAHRWGSIDTTSLPITAQGDIVIGILRLKDLLTAIESNNHAMATVGEIADHNAPFAREYESLENAILRSGGQYRRIPVVNSAGGLVGCLDMDSMMARGSLRKHLASRPPVIDRFDAVT
ncbi:putative peptidase M50 and CBS [Rhodopirellula maiorica SM1]|uniref:Zinc metalloprotease n=1 Tax=Rhodopirellula maiorica SM1 TaxID=1265738 RepID=M5RLW2_9BACT|nr:site-2 protease family protein [Rhodopirellula maiorica]EMI16372.1 putative peptidase M50 and CBS [Rhodopirellula maiorica SM1]